MSPTDLIDLGPIPVTSTLPDSSAGGMVDLGPAESADLGPAESDEEITPVNYGRFAAARIAQARRKAQAAGHDLSNPEQLAIMDAYRQAAGLPTLSNIDTHKEAVQHIARHQSDVLNLARAVGSAFERQAVDLVAPAVDLIHPGWGTETRRDIAAMNPFDPDRITGKAGGAVASLPLLLAGGGVKTAAAVFGLESMTESLATSVDTGVTGAKKWLGAAGQGAITAVAILLGGKIAEWATKGLAGKIPQLQRLLTAGQIDTAAQVIAREAALVGINLPTQGAAMLAGTIGSNLMAQQTTDPARRWDDGLGETAFNLAAITIGNHVARAASGVSAARGAAKGRAEAARIEAGPRPEEAGAVVSGTEGYPVPPLVKYEPGGGPLAVVPGEGVRSAGPVIPVDRGRVYSQPGPDLPRVLVPPPAAGDVSPEETLATIARLAKNIPSPPPTPGAMFPIVKRPTGGPLAVTKKKPLVTPPPGGEEPVYGKPGPPAPRVVVPFPSVKQITPEQTLELLNIAARDIPAPPSSTGPEARVPEAPPSPTITPLSVDYPTGREPSIVSGLAIQGMGGTGADPGTVYISRSLPQVIDIDGQPVDAHRFIAVHETTERRLMDAGYTYEEAHPQATAAEHNAVRKAGIDPVAYEEALAPYEAAAKKEALAAAPADLDTRPYLEQPPVLPRPVSVVMSEGDIHRTPEGVRVNAPHATYEIADYMARGAEAGPFITEAGAGKNLWMRPAAEQSNAKRVLLVQFSTNLINADRPKTSADAYYDKLYSNRPGYSRPSDFWELPQWIGVAAHNLPNSDVYVVRDMTEAARFLDTAKYGEVAFSALDVNSPLIQKLLAGYKGKVAIGGYTDMTPFKGGVIPQPQKGDLYHVSFRRNADAIQREGLRAGQPSNWPDWIEQGHVYLASSEAKALQWAKDLMKEHPKTEVDDLDIYLVRPDPSRVLPDVGTNKKIAGNIPPEQIQKYSSYEAKTSPTGKVSFEAQKPDMDRSNVTVYDKMSDWIGPKFKDGIDYRHFRGTETQPRLQLSTGCLHKCGFCSMPRVIVETTPEGAQQQIKSFGDLKYRLVYLNDKTFGQADNYTDLVKINKQLQEQNPQFEGFIIQTTASQMLKFTPEFLRDSGIKYVELGVESYNDLILHPLHKPANEAIIDKATDVIRKAGMKLIPNIIVGLPDETAATYAKTQDYLKRNIDVISHVNVNNLGLYKDTELLAKLGKVQPEDVDQNTPVKSFHKDPALHQAAYEEFTKIGDAALSIPSPESTRPQPGLLHQLHRDQQGAIPADKLLNSLGAEDVIAAGKQAADAITSAAADLQRTFSPGSRGEQAKLTTAEMRRENSRAARKVDIRYRAYDAARQAFDKYIRVNGQAAADDFMDRINRGEKQADPKLQALADHLDAERRAKVAVMDALGTGATEKFDENWFGRQWENADQARLYFRARKPLTGPKTFLKGRTLESVAEGRSLGLKLVTDNPVEMHLMKMGEMDKYIAGVNTIHGLEAQGAAMKIKSGQAVPTGWQRIHDQIGLYKAKNPVTGEVEPGSYYAPEPVATLINNHLSPGLRNKAWFRTYLGAANWMNQFQLGMSGFHIAFTSADAIVSKVALSLREGFKGNLVGAVKDILGAPGAPVTNAIRGHKGLMEWFRPGSQSPEVQQIIGILEDAGARVQSDPFYRTHISDRMMSAWRKGNVLGAFGRALLLPVELPTRFIMDVIVPRQKLGVAMDIVAMEMRTNPGISREALVAKARSAWDSADNRMGQLVYDNLFWNRLVKDMAMASIRSVGWNLGTFREVLGGVVDLAKQPITALRGKPTELTNRAAYFVALPAVHVAIGSFLTYVFTGRGPQSLRDAMFPPTGEKDEKGNPQRIALPTYMKDLYHFGHEPLKTLGNKLHPMLNLIHEMLVNKDYYGEKIRNEDDPLIQQAKQMAVAAMQSMEPLSTRNLRRGLELGASPASAAKSFIGLTPAPSIINMSEAERVAAEMVREKIPVGARTHEQVEKSRLKHDIARRIGQGDTTALSAAVQAGQLSRDDARAIVKESGQRPLQVQLTRLSAKEALQVWMKATPEERTNIRIPLLRKLRAMQSRATAAEFKEMVDQYKLAGVLQ